MLHVAAGSYGATWLDTRRGARQPAGSVQGNGSPLPFTAPSTPTDWVPLLTASS